MTPEERNEELEELISDAMGQLLHIVSTRALALLELLDRKGLLDDEEVIATLEELVQAPESGLQFGAECRAFPRWRRQQACSEYPAEDSRNRQPES